MASIKFSLQSKSNSASIYLRLSINRNKSLKRKTTISIDSNEWSATTGFPKQTNPTNKNITTKLKSLSNHIINELNNSETNENDLTGNWLFEKINTYFNKKETSSLERLVEYGNHFVENLKYKVSKKGTGGVSESTIKKYKTIVKKLEGYQEKANKVLLVENVNSDFRREFIKYLSEVDKLNSNTIGRYLKFVKSICLDAQRNGIKTSLQLEHFKGFTVKSPKVVLSFEELEQIKNTNLINETHQIARDWLIIGCYTGQRVSDLLRMNKTHIDNIQSFQFIILEQVKTGKTVQIPLHKEVQQILLKRNGEFPPIFAKNIDSNKSLFNRYLKQLCKIAEIDTVVEGNFFDQETKRTINGNYEKHLLVSSHICRRSFATNYYGKPEYPTPLLMNITAHSSEKMFLEYIGKKPIDYSLQLAKIWAKESIKLKEVKTMEVVKKKAN